MLALHENAKPAHHGKNDGMNHAITDQHWTDMKEALEYAIQLVQDDIQAQKDADEIFDQITAEEAKSDALLGIGTV